MSTGGRSRRDTANQIAAKVRSAEKRRCPKCGRGAALVRFEGTTYCRWNLKGKCDYVQVRWL